MGLVLDSSVAIAAERRGLPVEGLLELVRGIAGPMEIALSVVSVMELEHGVWRAKDEARVIRRRQFLDDPKRRSGGPGRRYSYLFRRRHGLGDPSERVYSILQISKHKATRRGLLRLRRPT